MLKDDMSMVAVDCGMDFRRFEVTEAWKRIKSFIEEAQNTSTNTAITKLPTFGDVYIPLDDAGEHREICLDFYQAMCRQLRNSQ